MSKIFIILLFICLIPLVGIAQSIELRGNVLSKISEKDYRPTFAVVAARLHTGLKREVALKQLDTLLSREYGDMFWMYGCAGLYLSSDSLLPQVYKLKIRECWKKYTPYRGDTENHFLMYYSSLYLMSEVWPDLEDTDWFMGKSSIEVHTEAEQYLDFWINRAVRFGQVEFDSPRYLYYFITPLILLSEYSKDSLMKKRSKMMLEYLLADYAVEYLNGNFCGANSRISNGAALDPKSAETTSYGEFFFEQAVNHILPDIAFAALSKFTIPKIIAEIALDRREPYGSKELKRSRDAIRYARELSSGVEKYTFMTSEFALGSISGGLIQPIQQRSWCLILNTNHQNNVIFGLHPHVSEKELGMFFPEEPSFMLEKIDAVKNGYTSEDKWVGGSPYESIEQFQNQIECKYSFPRKEKYQHVDLFIPGWGKFLPSDSTQPRLIRIQYDSSVVSIVTRTPFEWKSEGENYRLRLSAVGRKTGYFISCDRADEFSELDNRTTLSTVRKKESNNEWLFSSPYLESWFGSGILKMKHGADERILDFTTNIIR